MSGFGKVLMTIAVILFVIGLSMQLTKIGRLPGDILIRKGNTTFYFPIATSIILSIVLSVLLYIIGRFK
ncbi:membrane protein [Weizmannia acidilactici]|uniref:Membrane protein n=1 Tax=Weizmannia acidilactici TaxID=2607726 RepID=A0A5J4JFC4_9BACI|nr:DUF2905 domain-containing protein [Weizmannia acidilactici]GER66213.1 membrane protein [Weizmannia acidilactici]GER69150.1 membrane protein [Weizmannia acidilactici]GER72153.1 membrane protein [Weizmannia acidilactici]